MRTALTMLAFLMALALLDGCQKAGTPGMSVQPAPFQGGDGGGGGGGGGY